PLFEELRRNQRVFSELIGWTGEQDRNLELDGRLLQATVPRASGDYYGSIGATPLLGRAIRHAVARAIPAAQVAGPRYDLWQPAWGGDPNIAGKAIRIDGQPSSIVGVSRKWFTGVTPGFAPDIRIPLTAGPFAGYMTNPAQAWILLTGRLKDGVNAEQ